MEVHFHVGPKGGGGFATGSPQGQLGETYPQRGRSKSSNRRSCRSHEHPRVEGGQAIAIGAVAVKGENMRPYGLVLVKVLHFEVDDLSLEFLRGVLPGNSSESEEGHTVRDDAWVEIWACSS